MNLDWTNQISAMTGTIMGLVAHIRHKRITLLQAAIMIRYVIGKKLEIGFRHSLIPQQKLAQWDQWLKDAISHRTDLPLPKLHKCSILPILKTIDLERTYVLEKTLSIFENLIKPSELKPHYEASFHSATSSPPPPPSDLSHTIQLLLKHRIRIITNTDHKPSERPRGSRAGDVTLLFQKEPIPIRLHQYTLWGKSFKPPSKDTHVTICTDGSSNYRSPAKWSGASIVYLDDDFLTDEYDNRHQHWGVDTRKSYTAELAAINKAIRSVPLTVALTIYTDSLSSIHKIHAYRQTGGLSAPMACVARPYMRAIASALSARDALHTPTTLLHVRSHTGLRDLQSIGNEAADRHAKTAYQDQEMSGDIFLMSHELPYVVEILPPPTPDEPSDPPSLEKPEPPKPIHDNIRKALREHLTSALVDEWASRPRRGELVRIHRRETLDLIDTLWRKPTSLKLTMLIDLLNQADRNYTSSQPTPHHCSRCGKAEIPTVTHRLLTCPSVADVWNGAEDKIAAIIAEHYDIREATGTISHRMNQLRSSYKLNSLGRTP